jgi:hypothetical protein
MFRQKSKKANNPQLKVAKLSDQLRHVRLQNDGLRIQVEANTGKASLFFPSRPTNRSQGRGQSQNKHLGKTQTPPTPSSILRLPLPLEKPQTAISQILGFLTQNIHSIFQHLPPFIHSLVSIYQSFTYSSTSAKTRVKTSTRTRIRDIEKGEADIEQEDTVQKLIAEKGAYKTALKERVCLSSLLHLDVIHRSGDDTDRQDAKISELADKLENQKKQNRGFIEVSPYYRNTLILLPCISGSVSRR